MTTRRDFLTAVAAALGVAPAVLARPVKPWKPIGHDWIDGVLAHPVVLPFMLHETVTIEPGKVFFERIFDGPVPFDFILHRLDIWIGDQRQNPYDFVLRRLFMTLRLKKQFAMGASTGLAPVQLNPPYRHVRGEEFSLDLDMGSEAVDIPEPVEVRSIISGYALHV